MSGQRGAYMPKHPPQKVNTFDAGLMYLYLSMKLASNIFDAVLGT